MLQKETVIKEIAQAIKVSPSTVYREIRRNSSERTCKYGFAAAQRKADGRKRRYRKPRKFTDDVRNDVIKHIKMDWSPRQITGCLKMSGGPSVSHETIYKLIRQDKACGGELYKHCRFRMKHINHWLRRKGRRLPGNKKSIDERPEEADGKRFGDWEMDLIVGSDGSSALTMTERSTNMMAVRKLPKYRTAKDVDRAVISVLAPLKEHVLTITTDNGSEFAYYKDIEKALNCQVYYAHPYSPWQKGAVENINMLIRQYIPKRFDIDNLSVQQIAAIERKINNRPRQKLNFKTPEFVFDKLIN